jgi:hypothetical protein
MEPPPHRADGDGESSGMKKRQIEPLSELRPRVAIPTSFEDGSLVGGLRHDASTGSDACLSPPRIEGRRREVYDEEEKEGSDILGGAGSSDGGGYWAQHLESSSVCRVIAEGRLVDLQVNQIDAYSFVLPPFPCKITCAAMGDMYSSKHTHR